jgi:hypothetical protein
MFINKTTIRGFNKMALMKNSPYEFIPAGHELKIKRIEYQPPPRPDLELVERERFFPLMVDPSVLLSTEHLSKLRKSEYTFFLSEELYNILVERDKKIIRYVLRHFCWPQYKKEIKVDFESVFRFIEEMAKIELYHANIKLKEEIEPKLEKIHLPAEVQRILVDEYSFLRERSSLLLRYKRTVNYFKRIGMPIIDMANLLKDKKEEIFHRIRGLKWLVALILFLPSDEKLLEILVQKGGIDPIFHLLVKGTTFILLVMDG